ncbi:MAG TPA: energy transducer TonB [Gemmatimonadales bacterium]|nr:energy transducer TonB [Gemmatimonadales bacterium]
MLPPPDAPSSLRGTQVEVTFFVGPDGAVDRVTITPAIRDGGFARKFEETMRNYRFRPARSPAGAPVPGSTTITVSFF